MYIYFLSLKIINISFTMPLFWDLYSFYPVSSTASVHGIFLIDSF